MTDASEKFGTAPAEWDELYQRHAQQVGAAPNGVLTALAAELPTGRALDVGCGLGSEAIWLASRGWQVTAIDVSKVALDRARRAALRGGLQIDWLCGLLEESDLPSGHFDLVTAFYPALHRSSGDVALNALLARVSPGGTLLVVHHADADPETAKSFGFDVDHYVGHDDLVAAIPSEWEVRVTRRKERTVRPEGPAGRHTHDDVIEARRPR